MKLQTNAYQAIQQYFTRFSYPPEAGGILGIHNGCITHFHGDTTGIYVEDRYTPNVSARNAQIALWHASNISFAGLIYSHSPSTTHLSSFDLELTRACLASSNLPWIYSVVVTLDEHGVIQFHPYRVSETLAVNDSIQLI